MAQSRLRAPILALAIFSLLAALWAGWIRIGWKWPSLQPNLPGAHGPLMVVGFLSTLIALERAVALKRGWMYLSPLFSGLGAFVIIVGVNNLIGLSLLTLGSLILLVIFYVILRQYTAWYTVAMALGALAFIIGNLLWMSGWSIPRVVPWWQTFLVLTIAGERLELGRLLRFSNRVIWVFASTLILIVSGLLVALFFARTGARLFSLGLFALAIWLYANDISRRTIFQHGLPRYAAMCLLAGFAWLAAGGLLGLIFGLQAAGLRYDAILHSVFIGFVISMIFGHAPIIFPSILGLPIRYSPLFYAHLILLHASLLLRVAGDLIQIVWLRQWGGLLNGIAVLIFLALTASAMATSRQRTA